MKRVRGKFRTRECLKSCSPRSTKVGVLFVAAAVADVVAAAAAAAAAIAVDKNHFSPLQYLLSTAFWPTKCLIMCCMMFARCSATTSSWPASWQFIAKNFVRASS